MDIVIAQATPSTLFPAAASPADTAAIAAPANPQAVERFTQALSGTSPAGGVGAVSGTPSAAPTALPTAVNGALGATGTGSAKASLGDTILKGLQNVSDDFSKSWASVSATLDGKVGSVTELLKLQMGMAQMSIQFELVGKGVSRTTQNIDQLVKLQ